MDAVRQYLLNVICASVICACIRLLLPQKQPGSKTVNMLCGIFLVICTISPLIQIQVEDWNFYTDSFSYDADRIVESASTDQADAYRESIKQLTQAYILDKAESYASELSVEVTLSEQDPPVPCAVTIDGTIPPQVKEKLEAFLEFEINIPKEAQTWIG